MTIIVIAIIPYITIAITVGGYKKTIQMTFDEKLLNNIDKEVKKLKTSRSVFTKNALRNFLKILHTKELEEKHRKGYSKKPVNLGEFDVWEDEQVWIE